MKKIEIIKNAVTSIIRNSTPKYDNNKLTTDIEYNYDK